MLYVRMISAGVAHTHTGSIEPWITRTTRATTQYRWQAANNFGTLCINRIHIGIHRCHWRCGRSLRYARNAASRDTSSASFPMEDIRLFCSILLLHIRFFYCQREPQQQHVVCRTKKYGDCDSIHTQTHILDDYNQHKQLIRSYSVRCSCGAFLRAL